MRGKNVWVRGLVIMIVMALFSCLPDKKYKDYVNHAPIISGLRDQKALVGDLIGISPSATDQDSNALSFSITGWMTETTKVALFSDLGAHTVTVTASDGISTSATSFTVSIGNYTWAEFTPTGFVVPKMEGQSGVYDILNKRMIVFGGFAPGLSYLNWTTALYLTALGYENWLDLNPSKCPSLPSNPPPSKRAHHSSIYDPFNQRMILFGGQVYTNPTLSYMNDFWGLSLTNTDGNWCPLTSSFVPEPRAEHSAIFDPVGYRMVVFGGTNFTNTPNATTPCTGNEADCIFGDLLFLDLATISWNILYPPGKMPSYRKGHTAVYDPDRKQMIIFGGRACPTTTCAETNDVWALDLSSPGNEAWKQIFPEGTPPEPRQGAAGVYIPGSGKILLVGGNNGAAAYGDVWFLNLERPTWGRVYPDGQNFPGRTSHTMVYDTYNSRLIVFGGLDNSGQGLQDTWSLK